MHLRLINLTRLVQGTDLARKWILLTPKWRKNSLTAWKVVNKCTKHPGVAFGGAPRAAGPWALLFLPWGRAPAGSRPHLCSGLLECLRIQVLRFQLDPDMNQAVSEALSPKFKGTEEDRRAELCLYFVACTRHRYKLLNARYLEEFMKGLGYE